MELRLKVLTLNCWDLAVISSDRKKRMLAIATELSSGEYDFVVLQEVWCKSDYELFANQAQDVLPYSHYFYSGIIGAGLCVFSKVQIVDVQFLPFQLNGYPHKFTHGDWFSGKGVGMCRVIYEGLDINIFTAHLHAEYDRQFDQYLHHRLCQAFDFSQFVKYVGQTGHLSIVAGDFNSEPVDLPSRIIRLNGNLKDAFVEQEQLGSDEIGATNCHLRNTYTPKWMKETTDVDPGKRIDYILYKHNQGIKMRVLSCTNPLDKCPDDTVSLSDHEAVVATFLVSKTQADKGAAMEEKDRSEHLAALKQAKSILEGNLSQLKKDKIFYSVACALLFCLVFGSIGLDYMPYAIPWLMTLLRILLVLFMLFCFWMAGVENAMERNTVQATERAITILLKN